MQVPNWDRTRCLKVSASPVGMSRPLQMLFGNFYLAVRSIKIYNVVSGKILCFVKCMIESVPVLNKKRTLANPKWDRTRNPEEQSSSDGIQHPMLTLIN